MVALACSRGWPALAVGVGARSERAVEDMHVLEAGVGAISLGDGADALESAALVQGDGARVRGHYGVELDAVEAELSRLLDGRLHQLPPHAVAARVGGDHVAAVRHVGAAPLAVRVQQIEANDARRPLF